jgi:hypothetical protein
MRKKPRLQYKELNTKAPRPTAPRSEASPTRAITAVSTKPRSGTAAFAKIAGTARARMRANVGESTLRGRGVDVSSKTAEGRTHGGTALAHFVVSRERRAPGIHPLASPPTLT